ncbi:MAG: fumarylacetoacetate hydrolase family protein [Chloroflexi bacterium]|nr:fumarylacetoacetate hydrolase family protein [Chloroflexota bacterium]
MKLVTYQLDDAPRLGAIVDQKIIDLATAYQAVSQSKTDPFPSTMIALLEEGDQGLEKVKAALAAGAETAVSHPLNTITYLPPVLKPEKVIALGRNYAAHAKEGGAEPPKFPMLFHKTATSLNGHNHPVIIPPITDRVDYEGELAIIIGKRCKNVSEVDALNYVGGYTVANDVSARDWQRRTSQFTAGKMLDTFGPLGPALITPDEIPDIQNLRIQTRLNSNTMQDGHTSMMIFSVAFTISYISQISTLEVGDVILTGTPEGVGFARTPPVYMQPGDEVTVEIERIGILSNQITA